MAAVPRESEVKVGTMYRIPSRTNELLALVVVHSNSWFLSCQRDAGGADRMAVDHSHHSTHP
jgi:hypothetical protein